ncbi:MAG: M28 family peptidase [Myxococcota bacterium]
MLQTIEVLASDELGGRYSLHPDIDRAAQVVADQLAAAGAKPVGDDYRHPFPIVVGADVTGPGELSVTRGSAAEAASNEQYGPMAGSASGSVTGPLVFVGYAAKASDGNDYDDLAGLPLEGSIAVMLLDAPRRPDTRALYDRVRSIGERYETQAEPLRAKKDTDALGKLQRQTRDELGVLVQPFLGGRPVPKTLTALPEDLLAPLDTDAFASLVFMPNADAEGPRFSFTAGRLRSKLKRLKDAGVAGVITVRGPRSFLDDTARDADVLPDLSARSPVRDAGMPVVQMKWKAADKLLSAKGRKLSSLQGQIERELAPASTELGATATLAVELTPREVMAPNVVAMIEGASKPDEFVILGAHYDHIGTDEDGRGHCRAQTKDTGNGETKDVVCNGADDNASGTAVVLEVARILGSRPTPPERTVVFALFAGEELGLLGSKALADNPPAAKPWDGGMAVAMINIDMVGRLRPDPGLLVGGVGSSPQWMGLFERAGIDDMPILFDRSITTRSDQASFYKYGIPVIFMFTGVHEDYHAPGDETSGIDPNGLGKVAGLTLGVIAQIADGAPIDFAEPATPEEGLVSALPGDNPATLERKVGYAQ